MKLPAAWLCCLLLTSPAWAADTVVTGKVYLERDGKPGRGATDPGLAGVQVSNGETIVKTAADGSYSLPVRDGQTVFVIKPDAYSFPKATDGLPSFWRLPPERLAGAEVRRHRRHQRCHPQLGFRAAVGSP